MVTKPMGQVAARLGEVDEALRSRTSDLPLPLPPLSSEERAADARLLSRTIETEIVPRLLLIHRRAPTAEEARTPPVRDADIAALVAALLAGDGSAAEDIVGSVRTRGATLEHVALDLMAPTARQLGAMWVEDDCTYTDVTLGVWRLQRILRALSPLFEPRADHVRGGTRRILLVPLPGEDHSFGTDMVAGFLRLAGWEVSNESVATVEELADRVRRDPAPIIGLSCGCGEDLPAVAGLVTLLRRAAGRPVGIMLGGPAFAKEAPRALCLGADAVAGDARHAVRQAEGLLQLLSLNH